MTKLWKAVTGPSAGLVQQHFVKSRLEELKRRNPGLEDAVARVITQHPSFAALNLAQTGNWLDVYSKINSNLKKSELTINFEPTSWFTNENNYETYAQTYERGFNADGANIIRNDAFGTGADRARVDDVVTLTPGMVYDHKGPKRGLSPGARAGQDVDKRMRFGGQQVVAGDGVKKVGVKSANPYFDPKTKQVFAALNYARRPHGSSINYGKGHLILSDRLKANALYFPADTFTIEILAERSSKHASSYQVAYGMLAAVIGMAGSKMVNDLIKACYFGVNGDDTEYADMLLEAHLFEEVRFTGGLVAVCLPMSFHGTPVAANARTFAKKHGASLRWIS